MCSSCFHRWIREGIREAGEQRSEEAGFQARFADHPPVLLRGPIREFIPGELARCDCVVVDIADWGRGVYGELGSAQATGQGLGLIARRQIACCVRASIGTMRL